MAVSFPLGRGNYHRCDNDEDSILEVELVNFPRSQPNDIDMVWLSVTEKFTEIGFYIQNKSSMEKFCQFCAAHEITLLPMQVFTKKIHFESDQLESIRRVLYLIFSNIQPANKKSSYLGDVWAEIAYFATRSKEIDQSMQGDYHNRQFHKVRFPMKSGAVYSWTDLFTREPSCFKNIAFSTRTGHCNYFTKGKIALGYTCHRLELSSKKFKYNPKRWFEKQKRITNTFSLMGYDTFIDSKKSKIRISCDYKEPHQFVDLLKFIFDHLNFENRTQFEQLLDRVRVHVIDHVTKI